MEPRLFTYVNEEGHECIAPRTRLSKSSTPNQRRRVALFTAPHNEAYRAAVAADSKWQSLTNPA